MHMLCNVLTIQIIYLQLLGIPWMLLGIPWMFDLSSEMISTTDKF